MERMERMEHIVLYYRVCAVKHAHGHVLARMEYYCKYVWCYTRTILQGTLRGTIQLSNDVINQPLLLPPPSSHSWISLLRPIHQSYSRVHTTPYYTILHHSLCAANRSVLAWSFRLRAIKSIICDCVLISWHTWHLSA